MRLRTFLLIVIGIAAAFTLNLISRQVLEAMVSPGPLSQVHAELESDCMSCHLPFAKKYQNRACSDCHEAVGKDVAAGTGFHGRDNAARTGNCAACHIDHMGRKAKLVKFDPRRFDHRISDFPLNGAHRTLACNACHLPAKRYAAAPFACIACHAKDDVHRGRFGKSCGACHGEADWKQLRAFDHALTGYPLIGGHIKATCVQCHVGERYAGTSRQCLACHRQDDVHKGSRGTDCAACHSPVGWKLASFNHDRDTRFALQGGHRGVTCQKCHGQAMERTRPSVSCSACHGAKDPHRGRFGTDCAKCHNIQNWKTRTFDHDRLTRFALRGAHRKLNCNACHKGSVIGPRPPRACYDCHRAKDVHRGRLGRNCAACHSSNSWKSNIRFDHALTRFPLVGKHRSVACKSCHADRNFTAKGVTCAACHADNFHKGTLGKSPDCARCHREDGWSRWRFDHDRQTSFRLDGAHASLACKACHSKPVQNPAISASCISCHRGDDKHKGAFGPKCGDCHTTGTFKGAKVDSRIGFGPNPASEELR